MRSSKTVLGSCLNVAPREIHFFAGSLFFAACSYATAPTSQQEPANSKSKRPATQETPSPDSQGIELQGAVSPPSTQTTASPQATGPSFAVLIFSRTTGFRHNSIPAGIQAFQELGREHHFAVQTTEDPNLFSDEGLKTFAAVVFLNTTGDVLGETQQAAFERYIQSGHGFLGIHAAADTEYDWPWYTGLLGAQFKTHPATQPATLVLENRKHPATWHLDRQWTRTDEWYDFRSNPRSNAGSKVQVLAHLDPTSYSGSVSGDDRPAIWFHEYDGGRSFYTVGGHTPESFSEPAFRQHLLGALRWVSGRSPKQSSKHK